MNPYSRLPIAIAAFAIATFVSASALSALPDPQSNPSSSIEDINVIGHRTIVKAPKFYSMDKEKKFSSARLDPSQFLNPQHYEFQLIIIKGS
jgi:hypothetical protein